jgi:hypothetical protein
MARTQKQPAPGNWQHQVDDLTAYERKDRGLAIYTRVRNPDGRGYREKQQLCDPIRDAAGKIDPRLEAEAIRMAVERQALRASGIDDVRTGPLTLERAFRRMLHDTEGRYAGATYRKYDVERYSKTILAILGAGLMCEAIRHAHYRKLWRALAHEHAKSGKYGPSAADKICGVLRTLISWLHEEELLEAGTGLPAASWKQTMKKEWTEITDEPVNPPRKPRYARSEQEKLWFALPLGDPRHEIGCQIGAEKRLGQVRRSRRSDVLPYGGHRIGRVRLHGKGRKSTGQPPILTMEARHVLTRAMTRGVLADLEAAYQRGEISDYYLIPGGRLHTVKTRKGSRLRARVENANRPWGRTGMRRAWLRLEAIAGVPHERGRDWYGLRRISTDLAEDVEKDDRVLNDTSGHEDSATRRKYQEDGRLGVAEASLRVRQQIRPKATRGRPA